MSIDEIITFLGWCTVINMGMLAFAAIIIFLFQGFVIRLHSKLSGVNASTLPTLYFSYMANYKIGILLLNFVPYVALKIMA